MFDHLDDPQPYVPSTELRPAVARRARSLRRRRRAAVGTVAAALVVVAGVASATTMVDRKLDDVQRVDVANLRTTTEPDDPKVVLFVGTDSDEGLASAERTGPFRTDTIILARVDPGQETLSILPIPRDLLVDIPGNGPGRINAAFAIGGPDLLIETIDQNLGIEVDRYAETDFHGAAAIGDALGGLSLSFPHPVRDGSVGLAAPAGCTRFDGTALLQIARARRLQFQQDGTWRSDPTADLGRIERQQAVATALLERLAALDLTRPGEVERLLDAVSDDLTVDAGTTNGDLLDLFRAIEGSEARSLRYPVRDAVLDQAQVLELDAGADAVTAAFLDVDEPQPPATPTVAEGTSPSTPATSVTTSSTVTTTTTPVWPTPAGAIPTPC